MRQTLYPLVLATAMAAAMAVAQTPPTTPPPQAQPQTGPATTQAQPRPQMQPEMQAQAKRKQSPRDQQTSTDQQTARDQQSATDQQTATDQAQSRTAQSPAETRPDARYPQPSGQDSRPDKSSHTTKLAEAQSNRGNGTVENRGAKTADQSKQVKKLAKNKTYTGRSGSKADTGTACSTARPTKNGGVDCGTTGDSATLGKTVTKPR